MKQSFAVFIALIMLVSFAFPFSAFADDEQPSNVINLTEEQMNTNAGKYMEEALAAAKKNASKSKPYTINIPSGTYNLKSALHIFSNTKLHLEDDTVLVKKFESSNMIKLGVKEEVNTGYSGYYNITIEGGTWDCNYTGTSCIMRFAHCNNITLRNTTLKNQKDAHHMELAGASNFYIYNCTFTGYKKTSGGDGEAIQIDPIHNTTHFPAYEKYDDTPCKNVSVTNCTFKDIYAGVGTRSGVIGSYFTNINISNNTFENVRDKAICAFNYRYSKIQNNKINGSTIGIIFEYYPASNLLGKLYMPNSSKASKKIITSTNCTISGNSMVVSNVTGRNNSCGIAVYGGTISKDYSKKVNLMQGNYFVEGLNVNRNTITSNHKSTKGMILTFVNKSYITNNYMTSNVNSAANGIAMSSSKKNYVTSNTIMKFFNGVSTAAKSNGNAFSKNTIHNNNSYAISIAKDSAAAIHFGNSVKNNKKGKYEINSKAYPLYGSNVKLKLKKDKKKKKVTLKWNQVKGVTGYVVYASTKPNTGYKKLKNIKGKKKVKLTFKNKKNKKYYYKVIPYKNANGSYIYGRESNVVR